MINGLLRFLSESRGTPCSSFTFMHFEDDGMYHFSHSPRRSPASCRRKILKLTTKNYLYRKHQKTLLKEQQWHTIF